MAALLYAATAAVVLGIVRRHVLPLTWRAGLALSLLPLLVTGYALVTNGVYGPIDLGYESEPLASVAADHGITGVVNPLLTDVHRLMIPWKKAVRYAFRHGDWPLWNPFSYSGDILAAASEPSPWHPFHLLSYVLPLAQSVTFHATLVLFAAALCTFLFTRDLGASEIAAAIAAAAWMLSTFLLFFAQTPLGSTVLLLPLILLAVRRILRDPRYGNLVLLTIALALSLLAGHPESALHVVSIGVAYGVFETIAMAMDRRRVGGATLSPLRGVACAVGAGVFALLLSAVHLLPFLEALPQTADYQHRATRMQTERRPVSIGAAGQRMVANVIPFALGSPASEDAHVPPAWREPVYGSAGSLLFAPAIVALIAWRDRAKWFLLALIVLGFLAGVSAPGITHALDKLPLFDIALNQRLVFAAVLALCILAAMGIELWMRERSRLLPIATFAVLAALTLATIALWPSLQSLGLSQPWLRARAARELIPLVLCAALLVQRPRARLGAAAILGLLLIQRMPADHALTPTYPATAFYPRTPLLDALPQDGSPYRVVGVSSTLVPNTSLHYELEDPRGFHGMTFARLAPTLTMWSQPQPVSFNTVDRLDARFLDFLNVRFAIGNAADPLPAGWNVRALFRGGRLLENPRALERAFVPRHIVANAPDDLALLSLASVDDLSERAWLAGNEPQADLANGPGTVRVQRDGTALRLDADMANDGWIVISETAWKGWRATVDGHAAPLRLANYAFLAVRVPKGKHDVRLRYLPRSFVAGGIVTLATIVGMILIRPSGTFSRTREKALGTPPVASPLSRLRERVAEGRVRVAPILALIRPSGIFSRTREKALAMMRSLLLLAILFAALPSFASFPAKRLFLPAAGHITAAGGIEYTTDLWITNTEDAAASVKIALLEAGKANAPHFKTVVIPKQSTAHFENVTESLLHRPGILGALLIRSDKEVVATARLAMMNGGPAAANGGGLNAIPIELAAGKGEPILLPGAGSGGGFRYNVHVVETNRSGIVIRLRVIDEDGKVAGQKEVLLRELESRTIPIGEITTNVPLRARIEVEVIRGSGRVIAAGSMIAPSGDPTTFEMNFPRRMRTDIPARELAVWIAAALALIVSAIWRRRRRA